MIVRYFLTQWYDHVNMMKSNLPDPDARETTFTMPIEFDHAMFLFFSVKCPSDLAMFSQSGCNFIHSERVFVCSKGSIRRPPNLLSSGSESCCSTGRHFQ